MRISSGTLAAICIASSALATTARAQAPLIQHEALRCLPREQFAVVSARIETPVSVRSAKLYFRSVHYPEFYFVELKPLGGQLAALLPQPSEETPEIVYYLEVVDNAFHSARTPEVTVPVREPCSERQSPVAQLGDDAGILVGSTSGSGGLPPGFKAIGIIGSITAAGIVSSGSGLGAGAAVAASAAAAAGAGAIVVATGGEDPSTTSTTTASPSGGPPSPGTTTSIGSGPSPPGTTTVLPTTTAPGGSATTTTTVPGGSTTTIPGSSTSTVSATTSAPTTTTTSVPPPVACFTVSLAGLCRLRLDASCSTGAIDAYDWVLDAGGQLNGPVALSGVVVEHTYGLLCSLQQVTNVLTVTGPGGSDVDSRTHTFLLQRNESSSLPSRFDTVLDVHEGAVPAGTLLVNDALVRAVPSGSLQSVSFTGREGTNVVDARIDSENGAGAVWTFDFARSEGFASGSLVVERGDAVAVDAARVVFRLGRNQSSAAVRFRFRLRR